MGLIVVAVLASSTALLITYWRWSRERNAMATWTPAAAARARELYFEFGGSTFWMSRDGFDDEYNALHVPPSVERIWRRELTAKYLAALDAPANFGSIMQFDHLWIYGHVKEVLAARPLGSWSEQVVFLEQLLDYVRHARWFFKASRYDLAAAARKVLVEGERLGVEAADEGDARRVAALMNRARRYVA